MRLFSIHLPHRKSSVSCKFDHLDKGDQGELFRITVFTDGCSWNSFNGDITAVKPFWLSRRDRVVFVGRVTVVGMEVHDIFDAETGSYKKLVQFVFLEGDENPQLWFFSEACAYRTPIPPSRAVWAAVVWFIFTQMSLLN
jgi:hypothetical protein